MKTQADKEATDFITVLVDKVLSRKPLTNEEVIPLAIFQQSVVPIPEPDKSKSKSKSKSKKKENG